jgi:hypothetical protein
VLEWIDSTQLAVWLRESPSVWASATVLTLHTTGLAILVGASWVLDLRLLGIGRKVPLSAFHWVFTAVALGLALNLATGVLLFIKNAAMWGTSLPFFIKMGLVIVSAGTLVPIRRYVLSGDAARAEVNSARLLAIASILAWSGAITAGRLLAYVAP